MYSYDSNDEPEEIACDMEGVCDQNERSLSESQHNLDDGEDRGDDGDSIKLLQASHR